MSLSGPRRRNPVVLAALVTAALVGSMTAGAVGANAAGPPAPAAPSHPAPPPKPTPPPKPPKTTEVQILGLNDFHGAIEPPTGSAGRLGPSGTPEFGGSEYLATHVRNLRATNPNTLFVSAGDLIGATPLTSALFHDEPTIEAFNLMGLDYNGVGNHEFDEGITELQRMQHGGCHPVDGCQDGDGFAGANFDFLAANVVYNDTAERKDRGKTIFAPFKIHKFKGAEVGIIGMTLEGTPDIVTPSGISTVDFLDEIETANAAVAELKRRHVETIVVLLHEGGTTSTAGNGTGAGADRINDCVNPAGALPPIVEGMDDAVDVVVTGHTNWAVNCVIDDKIVTGAGANGRIITDIDLTIDNKSRDVVSASVNNRAVSRDVEKAADLTALVAKYKGLSSPLANRVVGSITGDITRTANLAGESSYGDVIADAQLAATTPENLGGSKVAFMNPGGIRGDLLSAVISGGEQAGQVTYGELFTTQPFSNTLTVLSCTGAQIEQVLEQQWQPNGTIVNILQVSNGFSYTYDRAAAIGSRVDPATIKIGGVVVDPAQSYRVTTNNFVATGGDGFTAFTQCTNPLGGAVDLDALAEYFGANSPIAPGPQNRITRLN
jgi:5'-nucleotidase